MTMRRREIAILVGLGMVFFAAFLVQPEWYLSSAKMRCPGVVEKTYESMASCSGPPGCMCYRPENIWAPLYWIAALLILGIGASLLLRARFVVAAFSLGMALGLFGAAALFVLSRREAFDAEAWLVGEWVVAIYTAFALLTFAVSRAFIHWIRKRLSRPDTSQEGMRGR